jgi:hypothetical protein
MTKIAKAKPKPRPATFEEMLKQDAETVAKHEPRFKRLEEQKKEILTITGRYNNLKQIWLEEIRNTNREYTKNYKKEPKTKKQSNSFKQQIL